MAQCTVLVDHHSTVIAMIEHPDRSVLIDADRTRPKQLALSSSTASENRLCFPSFGWDSQQRMIGSIGIPDGTIGVTIDSDRHPTVAIDHLRLRLSLFKSQQ
jgi:hypothetical protein